MVLGGISQFFPPSLSSIIVGVYVIIFGLGMLAHHSAESTKLMSSQWSPVLSSCPTFRTTPTAMLRSCFRSSAVVFVSCSPAPKMAPALTFCPVYIFVGCILLHDAILREIAASIVGIIGIAYLVLEFIPSIEPPSNMRESDQGWGAEQV